MIAQYDSWKTSYPQSWDGPEELELEGDRLFYLGEEELAEYGYTEVAPTAAAMYAAGFLEWDDLTSEEHDGADAIIFDLTQSHIRPARRAA